MNRSRRWAAVLAAAGVTTAALTITPAADAAPLSCTAFVPNPAPVRAEGTNEKLGDVIVACTGGIPTQNLQVIPRVDWTLFVNTDATPRVLATNNKWVDALLLLDERSPTASPPTGNQEPCSLTGGICKNIGNGFGMATGASPNYYSGQGAGTNVNVFQG